MKALDCILCDKADLRWGGLCYSCKTILEERNELFEIMLDSLTTHTLEVSEESVKKVRKLYIELALLKENDL